MKIHLYSVCYNEEIMLPYYLKHYSKFVDEITIYDNFSTDSSIEIMKQNNVNIIPFDSNNEYCESILLNIRNTCWKNSKSDLVIVCDIDEIIYHPDIINELELILSKNYTIIRPKGFQMMSEKLPITNEQIYDELNYGFFDDRYSKPCIFNPSKVNINFAVGSHTSSPIGVVNMFNSENIKLLHYKHISREYEIIRNKLYGNRTSKLSRQRQWGEYIMKDETYVNSYYNKNIIKSIKVI